MAAKRVLSLRVTEDEAAQIELAAGRLGMPVAQYLRRCVLGLRSEPYLTGTPTYTLGTPASLITWNWKVA
jgi:Mobilization protein NikA